MTKPSENKIKENLEKIIEGKNRLEKCHLCGFTPKSYLRNKKASVSTHLWQAHREKYQNKVEQILSLISASNIKLLEEVKNKLIGENEDHSYFTATQSIGIIERNKLRAEQRKLLQTLNK